MAKVYQPGTEIDSKDFVFGLDPREWNGFFSKGIGSDNGHNEHVFRLDPREWDGTFQEKAKVLMTAMMMTISSALIRVSGKVSSLRSRPRSRYWNPKLSMAMNF